MEVMWIRGNNDNIDEAVRGLDIFTKNWCMDCIATANNNEPVFRCDKCEFYDQETGICYIKKFAHHHDHNYPMNNFGAMGNL